MKQKGRRSFRRGQHRFRVVNRRRFMAAQAALAVIALGALGLAASSVARSARTARLNRGLASMHAAGGAAPEVQVAAPPVATAAPTPAALEIAWMGRPEGTAISASARSGPWHETMTDVLPDMLSLLRQNGDTVGWLYIGGIVNLPVVYRDNAYYLTHDFSGAKNASGALFLDEYHPLTAGSRNLLIHGHSMYDGSMFGLLTHYRRLETLRQHPLIEFSTLWEKETYAVFAVVRTPAEGGLAYDSHPDFASDAAFEDYIREVRAASMFDVPVDVGPGDALLTLATCIDDDRLAVFARRLRPGETRDEIVSAMEAVGIRQ